MRKQNDLMKAGLKFNQGVTFKGNFSADELRAIEKTQVQNFYPSDFAHKKYIHLGTQQHSGYTEKNYFTN